MLLTLALVVFAGAIITLFSQEFFSLFKKIMKIKGAKLIIPLAIASWAVVTCDYWFIWGLNGYRDMLHTILNAMVWVMPSYPICTYIVIILFLTVISVGPVMLLDLIFLKRTYKYYPCPYLTSILIWLINVFTLTVI